MPPSVSPPPVPLVARSRAGSISEIEPVILEPPVTSNPAHCRPALPHADIATIRRLSTRVNVLPVLGRADVLTNERLAAVKTAVRRDLAEAGIGFGIFDVDNFPQPQYPQYSRRDSSENIPPKLENGYSNHTNGASSSATSPPSTPMSPPSYLRVPYAVISPDIYSHSDGVARPAPSRHELALQYTPLQQFPNHKQQPFAKIVPGKFTRSYRWGFLDVMDTTHCDFVQLRGAIFHHMQVRLSYCVGIHECLLTTSGVFGVFTADSAKIHKRVPLPKVQGGDSAATALYPNSGAPRTSRNAAPTSRSFSCVSPHPCYRHYTVPRCREGTTAAGSSGHHLTKRRRHIAVCRLAPASCPLGRALGSLAGHRNYLESVIFLFREVP